LPIPLDPPTTSTFLPLKSRSDTAARHIRLIR
jgi:hypothetical protein